jgi:hypothetical protein
MRATIGQLQSTHASISLEARQETAMVALHNVDGTASTTRIHGHSSNNE